MAVSAEGLALIFRIVGKGGSEAAAEIMKPGKAAEQVKAATKDTFTPLGQSADKSLPSVSKLQSGLTVALPIITAIGGAAIGAGTAIFGLTKRASDAGSEIFEAGQKSNLSAGFLSVLKVQAEQSGSSFEGAAARVTKWGNTLVDAARGNAELTRDLKRFGIDAAEAYRNPEAALKTFIENFNKLPPSAANNEAAMKLFKDRSGELIPVLRAFGTDYEGLVKKLDASGQIWDDSGTAKADAFGDALTELGQTATGIGNVFARELMPDITSAMKGITAAVTENRDRVREWGRDVGDVIRGIREVADSHFGTVVSWLAKVAAYTTPLALLINQTRELGAQSRGTTEPGPGDPGRRFGGMANAPPAGAVKTGGQEGSPAPDDVTNEAATKERARKLEAARKAELRAAEAAEEERLSMMRRFNDKVNALIDANRRELEEAEEETAKGMRKRAEERISALEAVKAAIKEEIAVLTDENTHLTEINETIKRAEILGAIDARTAAFLRQLAAVNAIADRIAETEPPVGADTKFPQGTGPYVDPGAFQEEFGAPPDLSPWENAISGLRSMAVDSFKAIGQAMGQAAAAAMVYGQSFGKAIHAATVAALASVATMAFVEAIKETALGFAKLAGFMPGPAALHFKAAGLWALAGVAAGGAGAALGSVGGGGAVAGSAFSSGGGAYNDRSDTRDRTIRENRTGGAPDPNQPANITVTLNVKSDGAAIVEHVKTDYQRGGALRSLFRSDMLGEAYSG